MNITQVLILSCVKCAHMEQRQSHNNTHYKFSGFIATGFCANEINLAIIHR